MRKLSVLWTTALALTIFAAGAHAQVNTEPPGVARISFVRGDVSMQRGDSGDDSAVELNTPLVAGDKVFTGSRSRAEVQLDWANMLRLDENAQADIATLDSRRIQVQLAQGLALFSVLKGSETDVEIDTPNVSIHPRREGRYRIEVLPSGDTLVTVQEGEADISTPDGSTILKKNQLITVRGVGNDAQFQTARADSTDEFDRWNNDRDRIIADAESYRRTNRYYTGAGDLDAYGRWDRVPDYGYVWVPRVTVGWAPYRHGRWVWTAYWGWTWTSYEPWGWAPYHYGRWFVHGGNWVWWPGPVTPVYRPVYAPAYVSFFGFNSHSGFSVGVSFGGGFGSIGWLPAGPCDFVSPWWGRNRNTFNVVNVTNITNVYNVNNVNVIRPLRGGNRDSNVHNMLVDNRVRYALSTVDAGNFGRGRANVRTVTTTELREARFMTGNVPVAPSRESLRASDRTVNTPAARSQGEPRFFSRRVPSTQRESFSAESAQVQQAIERDGFGSSSQNAGNRNPGNRDTAARGADNRPGAPAAGNRGPETRGLEGREPNRGPVNGGGFGNRNSGNAGVNSARQAPQAAPAPSAPDARREPNGGWRRFGAGQPATTDSQASQPQREPVLRSPRQRSSSSEALPNRLEPQANQPAPTADENRSADTQPGFRRFSGQRERERDTRQFVAQTSGGDQQQTQTQQNSDTNRPNGWQRFTGGQRPSSTNSGGSNTNNTQATPPRTETRPQIQLNRPIVQPREQAQPRPAPQLREPAPPRDSTTRGFGGSPRGASRESAPATSDRFVTTPRSAPAPSSPAPAPSSSAGARSAPSTSSQGGGSRSAPSSSSSRGRSSERDNR